MKKLYLLLIVFSSQCIVAQKKDLRQKTLVLRRFLEMNHYKPLQWNDSSSTMLYNIWLEKLDDEKIYFTQNDIAALEPFKTKLDEELMGKTAATDFFNRSTALFRMRLQKTDRICPGKAIGFLQA